MIIVKNKIATDPDSGLRCVTDLADGSYPTKQIVQPNNKGYRVPASAHLSNPEPHSVRGFNTIGNY